MFRRSYFTRATSDFTLLTYGTVHCVVLFSLAGLWVKAAFQQLSWHPECCIHLCQRIRFLTAQPAHSREASVNPLRVVDTSWRPETLLIISKWPWVNNSLNIPYLGQLYRMCGTSCHFLLFSEMIMGSLHTGNHTPSARSRFLDSMLQDRHTYKKPPSVMVAQHIFI